MGLLPRVLLHVVHPEMPATAASAGSVQCPCTVAPVQTIDQMLASLRHRPGTGLFVGGGNHSCGVSRGAATQL